MRNSIIKAFSLGIIAGSFLTAALITLAAPAKAEPDGAAIAFAVVYGQIVCDVLDDHPTESGIMGIGEALVNEGLTWRQAGQAIYIAVDDYCPHHLALIEAFANNQLGNIA